MAEPWSWSASAEIWSAPNMLSTRENTHSDAADEHYYCCSAKMMRAALAHAGMDGQFVRHQETR